MEKKAVCLMSGGLDSTTAAVKARNDGYQIQGLTVIYQENKEYEMLKKATQVLDIPLVRIELNLTPIGFPNPGEAESEYDEVPKSYSPFRNPILLSLAVSYAMSVEASKVYVGFEEEAEYPDTTLQFVKAFNDMILAGTPADVDVKVEAPFVHMEKTDVIEIAKKLGVPMKYTWSCYKNQSEPCLECNGCKERIKGFMRVGIRDPLLPKDAWEKLKRSKNF